MGLLRKEKDEECNTQNSHSKTGGRDPRELELEGSAHPRNSLGRLFVIILGKPEYI